MQKKLEKIEKILDEHVRPMLHQHKGNIELVEIRDKIAYVKFRGHCSGCPSAKYTMESIVKEELLKYTDIVEDVKIWEEVSQELYDFAKSFLQKAAV